MSIEILGDKIICKKMKIPSAPAQKYLHGITIDDIYEILNEWDYEAYDKNSLTLANTLKMFFHNNSISIGKSIDQLTTNEG